MCIIYCKYVLLYDLFNPSRGGDGGDLRMCVLGEELALYFCFYRRGGGGIGQMEPCLCIVESPS